jgi:hypothetical protein
VKSKGQTAGSEEERIMQPAEMSKGLTAWHNSEKVVQPVKKKKVNQPMFNILLININL